MSLILIRHGETALNAARVMQPEATPLSATGLRQAEALARRVASLGPAALVSSDLPRAWRTAQAIASASGLDVTASVLLRERNFGELRGLPYDTLGFDPLAMNGAPAGGESAAEFTQRIAQAFAWLVLRRASADGPLAVVTHGLVIHEVLARHAGLAPATQVPVRIANASITIIDAQPPHAVALLDCTIHLQSGARGAADGLSGG